MRREYLSPERWEKYITEEDIPVESVVIMGKKIKETDDNKVALLLEESLMGTNYYIHCWKPGVQDVSFYNKKDYLKIVDRIKQSLKN